uniref:Plant heme peroxidase family profile domain-containing protein n=1 Tax=Aegilops tauschii subsp. strangulata TaxID=200361 RepID=A0A453MTR2_AEGTS
MAELRRLLAEAGGLPDDPGRQGCRGQRPSVPLQGVLPRHNRPRRKRVRLQSGGPNYTVELGRYDGKISTRNSVMLPHVDDNLDSLNAFFYTLGLSQIDMIALSGAHTLGAADCGFFQHRTKGRDPSMNPSFDAQLQGTCARQNSAFLDDVTPVGFDNSYFQLLQKGRGLLGSDQVLYTDERSRGTVDYYSSNQGTFFYDFSVAMTKLGRVGVKTAVDGEIRRDCRYPN